MNLDRFLGLFISITLLIWIMIFALSPQPRYQKKIEIQIPKLPDPSIDIMSLKEIEFNEVKTETKKNNLKDDLPSAKEKVEVIDFNLYVYKIGAFKSSDKISKLIRSYNDAGFPAFTNQNKSNAKLTNVLVGPFASKKDILDNQDTLNKIADIKLGEVVSWNP